MKLRSAHSHRRHRTGLDTAMRPGYLAGVAGLLALVVGAFAIYGLRESRLALLQSMESGALSLAAAVASAGENQLRADAALEYLLAENLLDAAGDIVDAEVADPAFDLTPLASGVTRADLFGPDGRLQASSEAEGMDPLEQDYWWKICQDWGLSDYGQAVIGEDVEGQYAVAVQRAGGGAVLVRGDASALRELRQTTGLGRLIVNLGESDGIVYTALQDTVMIRAASRGVTSLSTVVDDPFLVAALSASTAQVRLTTHDGVEVLETVMAIAVDGDLYGLLRIAQSLDELDRLERRQRLQLLLVAGLLLAIGSVGFAVVTVRQNYAVLDRAYERIQTYSSTLLEQLGDAVVAMDADGRVEVFNAAAAALFGHPPDDVVGRPYTEILGPCEPLQNALSTQEDLQAASFQIRGEGVARKVSASSARIESDEATTIVVVLQDQTEREALETNLQRSERLASMGALAAGVAHEVRNPLNAIGLIAQRLQREFEPRDGAADYERMTATVRSEVKRVNRIVSDFLSLARPPQIDWQHINAGDLIAAAAATVESQTAVQGLRLIVETDTATVEGDRDQLQQVLQNLLNNAIDATPKGGTITLAASTEDDQLLLSVTDTGRGIPAEERERIFDLYYTTKASGTGLGLSLVQRIVAEHGGRLHVDSDEGVGTTITVRLPRQRPG